MCVLVLRIVRSRKGKGIGGGLVVCGVVVQCTSGKDGGDARHSHRTHSHAIEKKKKSVQRRCGGTLLALSTHTVREHLLEKS